MKGYGVRTFRLVDTQGHWQFVKFHWKPVKGVCSLVWDDAQRLCGCDPDFNRRDLWESIDAATFPNSSSAFRSWKDLPQRATRERW